MRAKGFLTVPLTATCPPVGDCRTSEGKEAAVTRGIGSRELGLRGIVTREEAAPSLTAVASQPASWTKGNFGSKHLVHIIHGVEC